MMKSYSDSEKKEHYTPPKKKEHSDFLISTLNYRQLNESLNRKSKSEKKAPVYTTRERGNPEAP